MILVAVFSPLWQAKICLGLTSAHIYQVRWWYWTLYTSATHLRGVYSFKMNGNICRGACSVQISDKISNTGQRKERKVIFKVIYCTSYWCEQIRRNINLSLLFCQLNQSHGDFPEVTFVTELKQRHTLPNSVSEDSNISGLQKNLFPHWRDENSHIHGV